MWRYRNPVDIWFGAGSLAELPALLRQRRYAVVTYSEPMFADLVARCASAAGAPALIIDDVAPNPDCALLDGRRPRAFASFLRRRRCILAIGGGSVIDSAKVFAVAGGDFSRVAALPGDANRAASDCRPTPIIAVPTTAGTGSEVTPWATVWDVQSGQKYSLSRPGLFPEHALIDPLLMVEKPGELTVSTGLDALSHALESLWNVNSNPVSASYAVAAAREILDALPRLVADLRNVALRTRMAKAALFAGLAFSNTQTAIAHSISYPFTLTFGVPHGIACSFTLPAVMRSVIGCGGLCEVSLRSIFGDDLHAGARRLERMIEDLGVATRPGGYGVNAGYLGQDDRRCLWRGARVAISSARASSSWLPHDSPRRHPLRQPDENTTGHKTRETMRSKTRTTRSGRDPMQSNADDIEARRHSGSQQASSSGARHPRARSSAKSEHDRVFDHPDRGDHAGGEPLQAADRHAQEEDRQEDRILYADFVCVSGRGSAQRLGAARGPRPGIVRHRQQAASKNIEVFATYAKNKGHLQEEGPGYRSILIRQQDERSRQHRKAQGQGAGTGRARQHLRRPGAAGRVRQGARHQPGKLLLQGRLHRRSRSRDAGREGRPRGCRVRGQRTASTTSSTASSSRPRISRCCGSRRWIPQDPFVYRADLCPELKSAISETFLQLHAEIRTPRSSWRTSRPNGSCRSADADYNVVRQAEASREALKK